MSEGVIRFRCEWRRAPLTVEPGVLSGLGRWRSRLREAGLVGALPDGVGFGNLSVRVGPLPAGDDQPSSIGFQGERGGATGGGRGSRPQALFVITGSGTGGLADLDASHYALVTGYRIEENTLTCRGLTRASSESLSHGAIYAARNDAGAVLHVHSELLWNRCREVLPTTGGAFLHGTPGMAKALADLVGGLGEERAHVVVMGGHRDGLVAFGPTLDEAGEKVLRLLASSRG